jgi:hypothetical protein
MLAAFRRVAITALVAGGAMCGTAVAMSPYTVHLSLPSTAKKGTSFHLRVYGESANTSKLTVFHDNAACATTSAREHARAGAMLFISKNVTGAYSVSATGHAVAVGKHYICAYLTGLPPQSLPRAHAMAAYTVT